jgi:hypothetical protein
MLIPGAPFTIDLLEQTSDVYWATVVDDEEVLLPGNVLNVLTLTLYVVKTDGTIAYVNNRNAQDVLNTNNVLVYNTLQSSPSGRTFNLKWQIQPEDTTFVEDLPFERHIALFEWEWPHAVGGQGHGKHEIIVAVKNLEQV